MGLVSKKIKPRFKCCKCKHVWHQHRRYVEHCPECESILVEWLNYAQWRKRYMSDGY